MRKRSLTRLLGLLGVTAAALSGAGASASPPAPPSQPGPPPNRPAVHPGAGPATDDGEAHVFPDRPVAPGTWSENMRYKFRLERIEACGPGPARTLKGEITWVGAFFSVEAKEPRIYVSARDIELRRGGVTIAATFIQPPDLPGCKPLLAPKQLRAGETLSGFALFEVPKQFRVTTADPIVVSYRPTRWGGARRAEVPVPECLDACSKPWVNKAAKAGEHAPASRRKL